MLLINKFDLQFSKSGVTQYIDTAKYVLLQKNDSIDTNCVYFNARKYRILTSSYITTNIFAYKVTTPSACFSFFVTNRLFLSPDFHHYYYFT